MTILKLGIIKHLHHTQLQYNIFFMYKILFSQSETK